MEFTESVATLEAVVKMTASTIKIRAANTVEIFVALEKWANVKENQTNKEAAVEHVALTQLDPAMLCEREAGSISRAADLAADAAEADLAAGDAGADLAAEDAEVLHV